MAIVKYFEDYCNLAKYKPCIFPILIFPPTVLLLAVVVHRRRADAWAEKELDDIRENIIAYEDEGGGEGDAGYDLHVLRQMYDTHPQESDPSFMHAPGTFRGFHQKCPGN